MNKVKIKIDETKIEFGLDKVKFILSSNFEKSFNLIQCIRKYFNKVESSEYHQEKGNITMFTVDDEVLTHNRNKLYMVDAMFDIDKDIKLGSRSIASKYMEAILEKIEFNELSVTINSLIKELADEISDIVSEKLKKDILIKINEINQKNLLKNIEISFIEDSLLQNQYDLTYEQIIIKQIKMINEISLSNQLVTNWIILNVPLITNKIYQEINKDLNNQKYIIIADDIRVHLENNEVYWNGEHKQFDLLDEVQIYNEFTMDYPEHIDLEASKYILNSFINRTDKEITIKLHKFM